MVDLERIANVRILPAIPEQKPVPKIEPLDVGDLVWIVYWRPFAMPGNPNAGSWDVMSGTVVSVGRKVCCEIHSPSTLPGNGGAWEAPPGSILRFAVPERVFRTELEATNYSQTLSPQ